MNLFEGSAGNAAPATRATTGQGCSTTSSRVRPSLPRSSSAPWRSSWDSTSGLSPSITKTPCDGPERTPNANAISAITTDCDKKKAGMIKLGYWNLDMIDAVGFVTSGSIFIGLLSAAVMIALHALRIIVNVVALHEVEIYAARRVFCRHCTERGRGGRRTRAGRATPPGEDPPPPYRPE